jgi:hypothetical protein
MVFAGLFMVHRIGNRTQLERLRRFRFRNRRRRRALIQNYSRRAITLKNSAAQYLGRRTGPATKILPPQPNRTPSWQILYPVLLTQSCQLYMCICRGHPTVNVREKRRSRLVGKSVHLFSRTPGTEEDSSCLATKNNPQQATVVERPLKIIVLV